MQDFDIPIDQNIPTPNDALAQTVRRWFAAWSPGDAPWNGAPFREVFKPGDGAIDVVDDMGGSIVTLTDVDEYIATWTPFMAPFSFWAIRPVGAVRARIANDLAVVTLRFEADGRDADGEPLLPKPGQIGTLVLERTEAGWRVVREHLTTVSQPAL